MIKCVCQLCQCSFVITLTVSNADIFRCRNYARIKKPHVNRFHGASSTNSSSKKNAIPFVLLNGMLSAFLLWAYIMSEEERSSDNNFYVNARWNGSECTVHCYLCISFAIICHKWNEVLFGHQRFKNRGHLTIKTDRFKNRNLITSN